jgi:hypothetical protein
MMDAFKSLLADENQLCKFKKAQSKFLNSLRKEFFIDKDIEFETKDCHLVRIFQMKVFLILEPRI